MITIERLDAEWNSIYPEGGLWKEGKFLLDQDQVKRFERLHQKMLAFMLGNADFPQSIEAFSVCGWSERHAYFRNKTATVKTIEEAQGILNELKKNQEWNIPTVIVKETWYLSKTSYITIMNFRAGEIANHTFSDHQVVVEKTMCGNRKYRWADLGLDNERVTY